MEKLKILIEKVLYGSIFVMILPLLLILWAKYTGAVIDFPVPGQVYTGYILLAAGALFVFTGVLHLHIYGNGLPMNAFPPEKFVKNGIYAFTRHPIYLGAVLMTFGLSVIFHSSSGFWLVSPLFTLMVITYVTGFENERTNIIFKPSDYKTFLSLPAADDMPLSVKERFCVLLFAYLPWILAFEAFRIPGIHGVVLISNLSFEQKLPVLQYTEIFYLLTYLFAFLVVTIAKTRQQLRSFITDLCFASIITGLIYLILPVIDKQKTFISDSVAGNIILAERDLNGAAIIFPSLQLIWTLISARYCVMIMKKRFRFIWYVLTIIILLSCITTGNHSLTDVLACFCIFLVVLNRHLIWDQIRVATEKLANSWHEWRWGPVRLINHGFYGGAAGFAGTLIAGFFIGGDYAFVIFIIMIVVIIGAGLWAQLIEGSSGLLRPFGYYGGLFAGIFAIIIVSLIFPVNVFILLGSVAMAASWVQAIGRLRCLVQGCCHGKPSNEKIGIHFTHPLSRVNKISGLNGVALHPTQLYSVGNNIISGLILIRLYNIEMPAIFITGIYFILNGLGRFVEESLRGEAQTPYWAGMRIYQWIAIINIIAGAAMTTIPDNNVLSFHFNSESIFFAIMIGILVTFASGVDFPESNRRFARLTSN